MLKHFLGSQCMLHIDENGNKIGHITLFKPETLLRCKSILKFRKQQQLKYGDLNIPGETSKGQGYHRGYQRFIGLSKVQKNKYEEWLASNQEEEQTETTTADDAETKKNTRSKIASPKPKEGTGIFQPVCLFCGKLRKKV